MHAPAFRHLATLQQLVEAGADVNARNASDATALLWCARNPEKARFLIEHGADVNVQSKQGVTALKVAALRPGGLETVALLLAKGAEVNVQGGLFNISPLFLAASIGEVETMRLLLTKELSRNNISIRECFIVYWLQWPTSLRLRRGTKL
jgi:ankyrin repeat protein